MIVLVTQFLTEKIQVTCFLYEREETNEIKTNKTDDETYSDGVWIKKKKNKKRENIVTCFSASTGGRLTPNPLA